VPQEKRKQLKISGKVNKIFGNPKHSEMYSKFLQIRQHEFNTHAINIP
jgi:hypothetical protein